MRIAKVFSTTMLFLLPIAPVLAQEKHEQEKQPEQKQQQAKPAQQQAKPEQQQQKRAAQPETKPAQQHTAQQQAKPEQEQQKRAAQPEAKPAQQQHASQQQAKPAQQRQAAQEPQRAGRSQAAGSHGRIPDDKFRASFGREHTFHVNRADFAGGSRRFQYGGYWFTPSQSWPADWLYTDNVYVDYMNGGYFLCDPVHPGVYLSISIG
jgi:hypothetical protein